MITPEQALAIYHAGPEAVLKVIGELSTRVDLEQQQIEALGKEVDALKRTVARLSKNSSNSSKPPSSDITKPKPQRSRKAKPKIGAQPGHPKHERPPFAQEDINAFHDYRLSACPECGNADVQLLDLPPRVMQQMELETFVVTKHEHRSYPVWCENCGQVHYHPFPRNVVKEGLLKERLSTLVAYMKAVDHASFSTIRKFIRDVLGEKVSRGYLRKIIEKVSHALDQPYEDLLNCLPLEQTLNVDETGHKENGEKFWTWVFRADLYVLFKIDKSRGSKVLVDVLGKQFEGVLGCDYFSAYRKYMKDFNITLQFCIAHLIRDIKYLTGLPDPETRAYAKKLLASVKNMFKVIHRRDDLDSKAFERALNLARQSIMDLALSEVPSRLDKNAKEQKREAFNMAKRFRDNGKAYFEFITTPGIEPTNNLAEQAVRFVVIDRHITQGTRSIKGRKSNERLWTVVGTCTLQGRSAFDFILKALSAYFRNQPAPSLLLGAT